LQERNTLIAASAAAELGRSAVQMIGRTTMRHFASFVAGVFFGGMAMCAIGVHPTETPPAIPQLKHPTGITITLHPWEASRSMDCRPVDIPPNKRELVIKLLTPGQYFGSEVHDFITPIVAEAVITHDDGTRTFVMVRDHGHNPAVVSVDGRNYFYARDYPGVPGGTLQLIHLVNDLVQSNKAAPPVR
jgi:hypothetical protein